MGQAEVERLKVHVKYEGGKIVCICSKFHKLCDASCPIEIVKLDRYQGWKKTFKQDKYGKSKC